VKCITGQERRSEPAANRAADRQIFARHNGEFIAAPNSRNRRRSAAEPRSRRSPAPLRALCLARGRRSLRSFGPYIQTRARGKLRGGRRGARGGAFRVPLECPLPPGTTGGTQLLIAGSLGIVSKAAVRGHPQLRLERCASAPSLRGVAASTDLVPPFRTEVVRWQVHNEPLTTTGRSAAPIARDCPWWTSPGPSSHLRSTRS
jgi:hypothetical protein